MIEMNNVRQDSRDYRRRWFFDDDFDLIAWYGHDGALAGFQLCYDKGGVEKALAWFTGRGLSHHLVDTGEQSPWYNRSPMLTASDGHAEMPRLRTAFTQVNANVPLELTTLVLEKIDAYAQHA